MARDIRQRVIIDAQDRTAKAASTARQNLNKVDGAMKRLENTIIGFAGLNILTSLSSGIIKMGDAAIDMNGKVKLVTDTTEEYTKAQKELLEISIDNGSQLESNTLLFTRINKPLKDLGYTLEQNLQFNRAIVEGLRVSSAGTQEADATIRQLSQAMMSGVLRGEELNSVMEQGGRIAEALAAGLGVSTGELRAMGAEGKLTADKVMEAILSQSAVITKEAASLPFTFERSIEVIRTKMLDMFQQNTQLNTALANAASGVSENFNELAAVIIPALQVALLGGLVLLGKWVNGKLAIHNATKALALEEETAAKNQQVNAIRSQIHAERQAALLAKETAATAKLDAFKTNAASRRLREEVAATRANILRLKAIETQLALDTRLGQMAIANERNEARKLVMISQLEQNQLRVVAVTNQLTSARTRLTAAETGLRVAVDRQTVAYDANIAAQSRASIANALMTNAYSSQSTRITALAERNMARTAGWATSASHSIQTVGTKMGSVMKTIGGGLLGWPGMLALVGYQVLSHFIDMEVGAWALMRGIERLLVAVGGVWDKLFNPEKYRAAMDAFDQETSDQIDEMIAKKEAQAKGFETVAAMEIAQAKQDAEQLISIEQSKQRRLLNTKAQASLKEKTLYKLKMDELREDTKLMREADEAAVKSTKTKTAAIVASAAIESAVRQSSVESVRVSEAAKTEALMSSNANVLKVELENIEARRKEWDEYYTNQLNNMDENGKTFLTISQRQQTKLSELDNMAVKSLTASLADMTKLRNGYLASVKSGIEEIADLRRSERDFVRSMTLDEMTDFERAADAQQQITDAKELLRKANQLDQVKDAEEIKALRAQATEDIKSVAQAEKARAKDFEKGSLEEITASNNKNDAMKLYSEIIDTSVEARESLNEIELRNADKIQEQLDNRVATIKEYQEKINEADLLAAKLRVLIIDADTSPAEKKLNALEARLEKFNKGLIDFDEVVGAAIEADQETNTAVGRNAIGLNTGGHVPGSGDKDTIPAMLTPGEFVLNKKVVAKMGLDKLYALNNGDIPIMRNSGGSVNAQTIDKRVTRIKDSINNQKQATNTIGGYGNLLGGNSPTGNSWQNDYYTALSTHASGLEGKDWKSVTSVQRLIDKALLTLSNSTRDNSFEGYTGFVAELSRLMPSIESAVASATDYTAPVTTSTAASTASTPTNAVTGTEETSNTVGKYGHLQLPKSQDDILSQARLDGATGRSLIPEFNLLTNEFDTLANAVAANSTIPSAPGQQSVGDSETIVIELKLGDNGATGTFKNDAATLAMLEELRNRGLTYGG